MEPRRRTGWATDPHQTSKSDLNFNSQLQDQALGGLRVKDVPAGDVDEDILQVYDTDSDEDKPSRVPRGYYRRPSKFWTQGTIFCVLVGGTGVFLYLVHFFSMKQLSRLKEDYGMHETKTKPDVEMWWQNTLAYHIYPRSFYDTDGDGIGDIKGIIHNMNHLEYLKVGSVMVSSMFKSPMIDHGRDVSDFMNVDPVYGTMKDFETMVEEFHRRNIKVILEMIPNHTSDKHKWFQESRKGGTATENKYADYYVWYEGRKLDNGTTIRPNNWLSRYGGSAWTWDPVRQAYYLHQFHSSMPDLNHTNSQLRQDLLKIWDFWLSKGIDGIWMDSVNAIFETDDVMLDEPESELPGALPGHYNFLEHVYTDDQPDVHEFMATYREFLDAYALKTKKKIFLGVDVQDPVVGNVIHYYYTGADAPLSYVLTYVDDTCDARCFLSIVDQWLQELPDGKPCFWVMSTPEAGRISSKRGPAFAAALAVLQLLLPGAAVVYYGEEVGMTHSDLSWADTVDIKARNYGQTFYKQNSRDPWRTPMQWSGERHAGFTQAERPWLPVHANHTTFNALKFRIEPDGHMNIYRLYTKLAELRQEPAFHYGRFRYAMSDDHILSFLRFAKDHPPYLVAINLGTEAVTTDFTLSVGMEFGKVAVAVKGSGGQHKTKEGDTVDLEKVTLEPADALVVKLF